MTANEIRSYLLQVPSPWDGDNRGLVGLYKNASGGGGVEEKKPPIAAAFLVSASLSGEPGYLLGRLRRLAKPAPPVSTRRSVIGSGTAAP